MRTLLVRAYVTGFGNMQLHRLNGDPIHAHVRFAAEDSSFKDVPTSIQATPLMHMAIETNPRIFAFDIADDGEVSMRLPNASEQRRSRPLSPQAEIEALRASLQRRETINLNALRSRVARKLDLRSRPAMAA